jgi:hypothetical protein
MNNTCVPIDQIQKDLSYYTFNFVFLDYFVDIDNFEQPIGSFLNSKILQSSLSNTNTCYLSYKGLNVISDDGWFLTNNNITSYFQYDYLDVTSSPAGTPINPLIAMIVSMGPLEENYYRAYIKIQQIIANAGGIIKVFSFVISLINNYFANFEIIENYIEDTSTNDNKVIQLVSNVSSDSVSRPKIYQHQNILNKNMKNNNNKNNINIIDNNNINNKIELNVNNNLKKIESTNFNRLSFCQKLFYFSVMRSEYCNEKWKLYEEVQKAIDESIDIYYIRKVFDKIAEKPNCNIKAIENMENIVSKESNNKAQKNNYLFN